MDSVIILNDRIDALEKLLAKELKTLHDGIAELTSEVDVIHKFFGNIMWG